MRIALQGHQPFAAAVKAIHDTLRALRDGTPPGKLTGIADAELMKRVTRDADYTKWTKDFLVLIAEIIPDVPLPARGRGKVRGLQRIGCL